MYFLIPIDSDGLSCERVDMKQSFAESDVVFSGKAISQEYVSSEYVFANGKNDTKTQFQVIESFKGNNTETIDVISSEWFWGYDFTRGSEYVVFAYDDGQYLRHQTCTPTSLLEHVELEKIRQVANDLESAVANSTHAKWNVGKVQWLEAIYLPSETGVVRVIDPDMNLNPEKVDNIGIDVWSDSHAKGFTSTATETGVSTGVFERTFTLSEERSAPNVLYVREGDTATVTYTDKTLPLEHPFSEIILMDTTLIGRSARPP